MDTLSPNNIIISIFRPTPIDRPHLAMEGGPVSAKICSTSIFSELIPSPVSSSAVLSEEKEQDHFPAAVS